MKWHRGHIGRFWDEDYKNFPYIRQPITDEEVNEWHSKGYDHVKSFTGVMYDSRNPMPEWTNRFTDIFSEYANLTFTFYKMQTLEIMPEHSDHYRTYRKVHQADYSDVVRILIMLEDWKPGHYLEIAGIGFTNWIAGDYFVWENDCPHAASNIGVEDRYTLQITGTKIKSEDIWKKTHWYYIPDLPTKAASKQPFLQSRILPSIGYNNQKPLMIYLYNEELKELDSITHDESTVNLLNEQGLDIYLYEPICSYVVGAEQKYPPLGTKHSMLFYSEFVGNEDPKNLRVDEFESILKYKHRNNLTNIRVHTCDYDVANQYPYYSSKLQLFTNDLFLKTVPPIEVTDESPSINFTKRFICMNWRWTPHRHLMAMFISQKDAYLSWYFRSDLFHIGKGIWYDLFEWQEEKSKLFELMLKGIRDLNRNTPYNLDLQIKEPSVIRHPYFIEFNPANNNTIYNIEEKHKNGIEKFYRDVFCDIVNETRFAQPTANYSEKVYNAIFYKKPFILMAPPKTLQYMREEGFKTFSDFWDESYDDIKCHKDRMLAVFNIIDQLNNMSIAELRIIYEKMIPILNHNYDLIKTKVLPLEKD